MADKALKERMNKPQFTFNFVEKVDPITYKSTFYIVNDDGERFESFADHEYEKANEVWLSYLSQDEKAQWDDYVADCDAAEAVWQEQQKERLHFSFN
jgi:hypothetical protein